MPNDSPTPTPAGQKPGIVQQVKDDFAKSQAIGEARVQAFEAKQGGWMRAHAPALIVGLAVGLVLGLFLAKL